MASAKTFEWLAPVGGGPSGAAMAGPRSEVGVARQATARISPGRLLVEGDANGGRAALLGQGDPALLGVRGVAGNGGRSIRQQVLPRPEGGVVLRRGTAPLQARRGFEVHERVLPGDDVQVRNVEGRETTGAAGGLDAQLRYRGWVPLSGNPHRKYAVYDLVYSASALPFGWSGSVAVFCKTMAVLTKALRAPDLASK